MEKIKLFVDSLVVGPNGWVSTRSVAEAIKYLHNDWVAEISLGYRMYDSNETYEPVARFITMMKERPKVHIHAEYPSDIKALSEVLGVKVAEKAS